MKLTIAQIAVLQRVLNQTGDATADGKPVMKTYSVKDFSAKKWFDKNADEVLKNYQKFLKKKQDEKKEEHKKEIEEEKKAINNLRGLAVKLSAEKDSREGVIAGCQKFLERQSVDKQIADELNTDKELLVEFQEKTHEIKIEKNTKDLLKKELEDYKFTEAEAPIVEVLDEIMA